MSGHLIRVVSRSIIETFSVSVMSGVMGSFGLVVGVILWGSDGIVVIGLIGRSRVVNGVTSVTNDVLLFTWCFTSRH